MAAACGEAADAITAADWMAAHPIMVAMEMVHGEISRGTPMLAHTPNEQSEFESLLIKR